MASSIGEVQQTFSSWDTCMTKDYCKWPAIVGIIVGSLVVLSVVLCVARCLCFGAECCACCFSCMSCCCPSRKKSARGYENFNAGPPAAPYRSYPQYSSPIAPVYTQPAPYRGPQTATFDAPSKTSTRYNEDALPSMPTWDTAASRRVEEEHVEMDRLESPQQSQQLVHREQLASPYGYAATSPYGQAQHDAAGPYGHAQHDTASQYSQLLASPYGPPRSPANPYMSGAYTQGPQSPGAYSAAAPRSPEYGQNHGSYQGVSPVYTQGHSSHSQPISPISRQSNDQYAANDRQPASINTNVAMPYHDYDSHQQYAPSMSPVSTAYAPSTVAPPSYHTREPSLVSPTRGNYNPIPARRPVQGTWRDV